MQESQPSTALDPEWIKSLSSLGGDSKFLGELLSLYLEESEIHFGEITAAVLSCDAQSASMAVHALGGSSRNIGATRLGVLCSAIEHALECQHRGLTAEERTELEMEHHAVRSAIDTVAPGCHDA